MYTYSQSEQQMFKNDEDKKDNTAGMTGYCLWLISA